MSGTRIALEAGSYAAGQTLLIVGVLSLSTFIICLTVIILVLSVGRPDRVEAIKALAPVLSRTKSAGSWRDKGGMHPHPRMRPKLHRSTRS